MWSVEVILKENNLKRSCSRCSNYRSRTPGGVARSTAREKRVVFHQHRLVAYLEKKPVLRVDVHDIPIKPEGKIVRQQQFVLV